MGQRRAYSKHRESSRRIVDLPEMAVVTLREHRRRTEGFAGFVFHDSNGRPIRKRKFLRRQFRPLIQRAELPRITFTACGTWRTRSCSSAERISAFWLIDSATLRSATTVEHYSQVLTGSQRARQRILDEVVGAANFSAIGHD